MKLENRLAQMIKYRDKAMLDPVANKLYIEDLDMSIAHLTYLKTIDKSTDKKYKLHSGFAIDGD